MKPIAVYSEYVGEDAIKHRARRVTSEDDTPRLLDVHARVRVSASIHPWDALCYGYKGVNSLT